MSAVNEGYKHPEKMKKEMLDVEKKAINFHDSGVGIL